MLSAPEVLNREFLDTRCRILDVAAAFDRLSRSPGTVADDPRVVRLREALTAVLEADENRAEQVQMIFSRPYEHGWQADLKVGTR